MTTTETNPMTTLAERDIEDLRDHFDKVINHIQDNGIEDAETETFALYWANRMTIEMDARQGKAGPWWQETAQVLTIGAFVRTERISA